MPNYTLNHALLRFGGTLAGSDEIWSCGLRLKHLGGDEINALRQETIDTIEEAAGYVSDYFTDVRAGFSALNRLAWVKLDAISASTGKYAFPNSPNTFEIDPVVSGTAGGMPPQVAYCVTLRGLNKRGPGARGRWYVPCGNLVNGQTGKMSDAVALEAANAAGDLLASLNTIDSGLGPDAWSPWLFGDGIGGPVDSSITALQVGTVFDTQRRRRNQLVETYIPSESWPI